MSWEANSMFKKLLHGKRKSALLNLTWSGLLCRVVWSVSQLLYLLQRAGHFKFFSPSFFVGLELKPILQHSRTPTIYSSRLRHSYPIAVTIGVAAACLDGPYPAITQRMTDATTDKRATS